MDRSGRAEPSRSDQHKRLQELADTFSEAWKNATSVPIPKYLPPAGDPLRIAALHALIRTDLEIRWQRGQRPLLESYVQQYPELGAPTALPVALVFEEFRLRELHNDHPDLGEYRLRFPAQYASLEQHVRQAPTQVGSAGTEPEAPPARTIDVPKSPPSSTIINGFKLMKKIGSGSFAEVWQGESRGGFPVAVKRIIKPLDDNEAQREMQALEAIKKLRHPFLLQTHDAFVVDNQLFVVMELADCTLRDRMKQCQKQGLPGIPLPELLCYFRESAEALDYMHGQHLFHRDIKPQNILILHGHAKVADFGLATLLNSQKLLMTATGSGTPAYMAPEVWQSKVSRNTDQYSLAAAFAEQRLGRWAFNGQDLMSLMVAHIQGQADLGNLPDAEKAVLNKGLARDPAQRYSSCTAFVQALEDALADELAKADPRPSVRRPTSGSFPGTGRVPGGSSTRPDGNQHTGLPGSPSATAPLAATADLPRPPVRWYRRLLPVAFLLVLAAAAGAAWFFGRGPADSAEFALVAPLARTLHAGEAGKLTIGIERRSYDGPIEVAVVDLPPGCVADVKPIAAKEAGTEIKLLVAPDAATVQSHPIRIRATGGSTQEKEVRLTIEPCWYRFEKNWQKAGYSKLEEHDGNRAYYTRIEVSRPGLDVPVRFVLVPQTGPADPPTFYMMEDKVWVDLFRQFAANPGKPLKNTEWSKLPYGKTDPDVPVMGVVAADAEQFARWLGGELPTTREWDKAIGRYEKPRPATPYKEPYKQGGVAIGLDAPMKRGKAELDISPFGVRDMAGNGREWTSVVAGETEDQGLRTPSISQLDDFQQLYVRGKMWNAKEPLSYRELESAQEGKFVVPPKGLPVDNTIGFRVVLELDK